VTAPRDFASTYAGALRGYLLVGGEGQLTAAYELGRRALAEGVTVLELSDAHHDALLEALAGLGDAGAAAPVVEGARDFLREALSAYEMVRRGFEDAREHAREARRDAAMVRRLADLLADPPPAGDAGWVQEVAQLVAEQARHLCRSAASLVVVVHGPDTVVAVEHDPADDGWEAFLGDPAVHERALDAEGPVRLQGADLAADVALQRAAATSPAARALTGWLLVPLRRADGRRFGAIALVATGGRAFSEVDADVARHLALLTTGALEQRDGAREPD
jgi:hypothetical protein